MLDIFRGLKSLVKISHVNTDSPVFRLHYSITVIILMSFSLIVTTRQYVGNPIDCVHTKDIPADVLNTYCWIHSTFALKSLFLKEVGKDVPYPGVGNSAEATAADKKIYKYYQWVCFCLFFQVSGCGWAGEGVPLPVRVCRLRVCVFLRVRVQCVVTMSLSCLNILHHETAKRRFSSAALQQAAALAQCCFGLPVTHRRNAARKAPGHY